MNKFVQIVLYVSGTVFAFVVLGTFLAIGISMWHMVLCEIGFIPHQFIGEFESCSL